MEDWLQKISRPILYLCKFWGISGRVIPWNLLSRYTASLQRPLDHCFDQTDAVLIEIAYLIGGHRLEL